MSKIIVFGGSGLVGQEVVRVLESVGHEVLAPSHHEEAIEERRARLYIGQQKPQFVINCTAYNDVDRAESDDGLKEAYDTNVRGVENLGLACAQSGSYFIHLSTDYVFDGKKPGAFLAEDEIPNPLGKYGWTKMMGEYRLAEIRSKFNLYYAVVRTSWVFGPGRKTYIDTILRNVFADHQAVDAYEDQVGTPTYAPHLAEGIREMVSQLHHVSLKPGMRLFHFANKTITTRETWMRYAMAAAQDRLKIDSYKPSIFKAKLFDSEIRPKETPLDCSKFERVFDFKIPTYMEATEEYIRDHACEEILTRVKMARDRNKARYQPTGVA